MRKKEDVGYGVIGIFLLVSLALVVLMSPYEPITTYAVQDVTGAATADFLGQNIILIVLVFLVLGFGIAGAVFLIKHHKEREKIIANIPPDSLANAHEYIRSTLAKGFSKDEVKAALMHQGWQESRVDAMLHEF
ncbi:MAG: hypothetical protein KKE20_02075 [Nanoarchaeota archaeon]|nr:hypothetical protein [Nanoarchaeota archaeon]